MSHVSSDAFLLWVWWASLALSATSLFVALCLALKRRIEESRSARKVALREDVARLVQALLAAPFEPGPGRVPPLPRGAEEALLDVALDVLRVTRGRDSDRMLALIEIWNLRPYLVQLLKGGQRSPKTRALTLLSRFRDDASLALLLRHLSDPGIYVQLAALRGVAERGDTAHLPRVVRALAGSRETNVPMLADILRRFGSPAVPAIAELAHAAGSRPVRLAAVTALGEIGALDALDPLRMLSADADPALRIRALESLAKLGDPRAGSTLVASLSDAEGRVRAAAAKAAGRLGLREALPALADALEDVVWEVRWRAAEALHALGAPGIAVLRAAATGATPGAEMSAELLAEKEGAAV